MNKFNTNKLIIFDILFKLVSIAIFYPIVQYILKIGMKVARISFLTNEYIIKYFANPITLLIFILAIYVVLLHLILEQQFIYAGCERVMGKHNTGISYIIGNGFRSFARYFSIDKLAALFHNLLILITLNVTIVVNILFNYFGFYSFVKDAFNNIKLLWLVAIGVILLLLMYSSRFLVASVIIYDKNCSFREAMIESNSFLRKHRKHIAFGILGYNIVLLLINIIISTLIVGVVILGVKIFNLDNMLAAIYFTVVRYMGVIINILITVISIPVAYCYVFYIYRKLNGTLSKDRVFDFRVNKKLIIVVLAVSCIINGAYITRAVSNNIFKRVEFLNFTEITAHRGSSIGALENTMEAFELALEQMADSIELDIRQSADGGFVVVHDENLKRTTGVDKVVGLTTKEELAAYVPTLEEVLEFAKGKIHLNIELKTAKTDKDYVSKLYAILEEYEFIDQCVITSSDYSVLREIKQLDENIITGYILNFAIGNYYDMEYIDFFSVNYKFVTSTMIGVLHNRGKQVHIWTLNDEDLIEKYVGMGVDGVITDDPILARNVIYSMELPDIFEYVLNYVLGK